MTPLPIQFNRSGWHSVQRERTAYTALYSKCKLDGSAFHYEVIVIQHQPTVLWPDGRITEAHEAYPSSEQWGKYGFTFSERSHSKPLEKARERMMALDARASGKEASLLEGKGSIAAFGKSQSK